MSEGVDEVQQEQEPVDPAAVLAALRTARTTADAAEATQLKLAVTWAIMHPPQSVEDAATWSSGPGRERARRLAGEGTPEVGEFCLADLATTLGLPPESGRAYLTAALELAYRLPRLYAAVMDGRLPAWRARRIAERTTGLSRAAAQFVDRHLVPVAHRAGPTVVDRAVGAAIAATDPDLAERLAREARDAEGVAKRFLDLDFKAAASDSAQGDLSGTVAVSGCLDLDDAVDLETALRHGAQLRADLGSDAPLDERRAHAAGDLARQQLGLDLTTDTDDPQPTARTIRPAKPTKPTKNVSLVVHLTRAALDGTGEVVTVRHPITGEVLTLAEQARTWCDQAATVTVQPVIDLTLDVDVVEQVVGHATSYRIPAHLDRLVRLRDRHCVFPYCTRPADACDLDHTVPYTAGGETCAANLAPLCRYHHRLKTHGRWHYRHLQPGHYEWTSPHRDTYRVDTRPHGGTTRGSPHAPPRGPTPAT
ncbi:HNH endonuclease signature motif containing protein [Nocardioides sp. CFH 31398]|uniref:HNH endonuclease signature motif containing protein n=1 Tax=Nocardioides sp. CFH 31398 TaxID=2919579 RepID=UPI001F065DE2|nr:HNH endonuclease signature motif containing protein [Nocardioides sp. CFH 31398]MCH1867026.1 HNH endonuclease [Nocardioides sp. CFH 31398]